jgi:hypothetical protein
MASGHANNRAQIGFRESDKAFVAVDDVAALQAAADKLNPVIIRERLETAYSSHYCTA